MPEDENDDERERPSHDVIPVPLVAKRPKRSEEQLEEHTFESMRGERVVVWSNGVRFGGRLVGADEDDLYLRGDTRYWALPLSNVSSVALEDDTRRPMGADAPGFREAMAQAEGDVDVERDGDVAADGDMTAAPGDDGD